MLSPLKIKRTIRRYHSSNAIRCPFNLAQTLHLFKKPFLPFLSLIIVSACSTKDKPPQYDFGHPKVIKLQKELREISGLSYYKKDKLIGVQDEKGCLYEIDLGKEKITEAFKFHKKGDFEGVEFVAPHAYAVDSDGDVFHIEYLDSKRQRDFKRETHLNKGLEIEGLMYHIPKEKLWLLSKVNSKTPYSRYFFEYDPKTKQLNKNPIVTVNLKVIIDKYENPEKFKPTAASMHPNTHHIYLLDSYLNRIIILKKDGRYVQTIQFPKKLFRQPEGLTFLPDGTMIIADEGQDHRGRLFIFPNTNATQVP